MVLTGATREMQENATPAKAPTDGAAEMRSRFVYGEATMSELFDKSIRTLELPAILKMLADQTNSAEAREKALALVPQTEREDVEHLQDETDAAREMIGLRGSPAFSGIKPVGESLYRADRGGALNTRELLDIAGVLRCARRVKDYYSEDGKKTSIDHLFASIRGNRFL